VWHASFPIWQLLRTRSMPSPKARGWLALNTVTQVAFVAGLVWALGPAALAYLLLSLYFTMAMHPIAARLFQEHHVVTDGQETYSYYGWLNALSLNIGYHVEHHDFPAVPWTRLPALRRLASERYDGELTSHASWGQLWLRFFTDARLGPFARIVRAGRPAPVAESPAAEPTCAPRLAVGPRLR